MSNAAVSELAHEVHTSERKSFKGCRLRWKFHFIDQWTPYGSAPPLEFGIAYHSAMEVLYEPTTWDWDKEVIGELAVKKFVDECARQKAEYLQESGNEDPDNSVKEDYEARVELGKGMLRYYYREQLAKNPEGFRPVKVEIGFKVPIKNPDTGEQLYCKCKSCWTRWFNAMLKTDKGDLFREHQGDVFWEAGLYTTWKGLPVVYAGRIDALVEDERGDYWIVDWKTAAYIREEDEEFLELDDQIGSYVWALVKILGINVRGFVYHQQRKGYPRPPQRNKHIRKGCSFSVSKQQETNYETFLKTVQLEDTLAYQAGLYDEFLAYLREEGITYFKRNTVIKTPRQLESIERDIYLEALDMIDPNIRIYRNAGRFSCKYCAFRQPCIGLARGEDVDYLFRTQYKQELPYYYRQERGPSTESKGGE